MLSRSPKLLLLLRNFIIVIPEEHQDLLNPLCRSTATLTHAHINRELFEDAGKRNKNTARVSGWDSAEIFTEEHDATAAFWILHRRGEEVGLLKYKTPAAESHVTSI
jgi:hypothetical protein